MSHSPRVLVVDDDENIVRAFRSFLKKEQCLMDGASNAEEAFSKLNRTEYGLIITDIRMEGQSGETLSLRIKHHHPEIPIIVITGYPDLISEEEVKKLGADYFFIKPLDLNELRKALRKSLRLNHISSHEES